MRVLIQAYSIRGRGRGRAFLSLCDRLSDEFEVTAVSGEHGWDKFSLEEHHGFFPDCGWDTMEWENRSPTSVTKELDDKFNPDAIISFDSHTNRGLKVVDDKPSIGYLRLNANNGADEYWAPSKKVAKDFNVLPLYPVWYIEQEEGYEERPIDIMLHSWKENDAVKGLQEDYNVLLANSFTYEELKDMFKRTKIFLFPRPDRFEPLGLMPIEAAAHGCELLLPENSGVCEIYPEASYEHPSGEVEQTIEGWRPHYRNIPMSPTNPVERIQELSTYYD